MRERLLKILHFADLHIGVENYGHIDPSTGLSTRMLDILAALDNLVDYAINNEVDLVLFCGDAYKSREPSQTQQREFAKRINRLSTAGIPVFLLVGNHDLPNAVGKATSTEIFSTLAVKNVHVSNRPEIVKIPTVHGVVQIVSLPWVRRGALLSKDDIRGLNIEQINQRLEQSLTGIVKTLAEKVDKTLPAILAAHLWVGAPNRKTREGTEKAMTLGQEHSLLTSSVANPAFSYVALGHIHVSQVLHDNPPIVYAGSLVKLDFGDEGDEKGFYEIDITSSDDAIPRALNYTFHPVRGREFLTISVTLDSKDIDPTDTIVKAIRQELPRVKDAIVRVQLFIPSELNKLINDTKIRAELAEAHYFNVSKNIERVSRLRLGVISTEQLQPIEALNLWLESKKVSPERTQLLLDYGKQLLDDEQLK